MATGEGHSLLASTVTSTHLLEGLREPDNRTVWKQFTDRYRPMIMDYARRSFGFGPQDAEDAAQVVLEAFFKAYRRGEYDREKGRLRKWLFAIAHNQIVNLLRKRPRREVQVAGDAGQSDFFARIVAEDDAEDIWEQEWRKSVLAACLEETRHQFDFKTFQAFEGVTTRGLSARQVAEELGMTPNAVYLAKHHVLKRIREMVPQMEEIW